MATLKLTDRQEPDDNDRNNPDDPNDYAIRYLFQANTSNRDLKRAGQVLLYSSAGTNLLAAGLYLAWLELQFKVWSLALVAAVVALSGLAALAYKRNRPNLAVRLAWLPLPLALAGLALLAALVLDPNAGFLAFLLPGSMTLFLAAALLLVAERRAEPL